MNSPTVPTSNGAHLWLGGDFNLGDIDWKNECTTTYPTHGAQCRQLLTASKDAFLTQMVTEPTRITESSSSILAQPVFDRLRRILRCFIYFQVLLFWLLLYIIYQSKSNKYRTIKI